jgi:dolichol-phosphate mannosyltransferase
MAEENRVPCEVPTFRVDEFAPRQNDYCVAIFVINENGKLHKQLERMKPYAGSVDILIADGGSTDGSVERDKVEPRGVNTVLTKTGPGKLGAQMRMAFRWAIDRGYRGIIAMDGNNKDGPEAIPEFVRLLDEGYDHVQGSRFIPGGVSENLPFSRWLGIKILHVPMMRWASRFRYTDTTNGFRAYSARFLDDARLSAFRDIFPGYELHYYLAIKAAQLGFRVTEIPVARRYPASGPVPTKISFFRGNYNVIQCLFRACTGYYDPPPATSTRKD